MALNGVEPEKKAALTALNQKKTIGINGIKAGKQQGQRCLLGKIAALMALNWKNSRVIGV